MRSQFPASRRALAPTLALCGLSLTLASGLLTGCSAGPAEAVTGWEPFKAKDASFAGDGPTGWEVSSGELGGTQAQVVYTKGNATISTVSDTASSFMGDAMKVGASKPVVEQLHEKSLESLGEKLSGLEAKTMQTMPSPLGQARYCEFTADNGNTHGYHVTIQGGERMFYVNTYCPESDWTTLRPAFNTFIGKLKPATG